MKRPSFLHRIRLRHIQCFIAVAQERNLGRAAERLRISAPAVSKTLSELDEISGLPLFQRNRMGARLTEEGERFMPHALRIMEALDGAASAVDMAGEANIETVQIGALPSVAPDLLPPAFKRFRQLHAGARVVVHTAANLQLLEMLKAGEIDFAVGRMSDPQMTVGLSFELLYMEPLALLAREGHPLCTAGMVTLSDALSHPLIVSPSGTVPRHNTESFIRSQGFRMPENCTETLSVALAQRLVQGSDAVWFAPLGVVGAHAKGKEAGLVTLPLAMAGTEEPVGLLRRAEVSLPQAVEEFMEALRGVAQQRRSDTLRTK